MWMWMLGCAPEPAVAADNFEVGAWVTRWSYSSPEDVQRLIGELEGPDENKETRFWDGQLVWGVRVRIEAAYGLWQYMVGSTGTA